MTERRAFAPQKGGLMGDRAPRLAPDAAKRSSSDAQTAFTAYHQAASEAIEALIARKSPPPLPHEDKDNVGSRHAYSLRRSMLMLAHDRRPDGLEAEVSQEIATRAGREPQGLFVPHSIETRSLSVVTGTGGIVTRIPGDIAMWSDVLRARMVLAQLGAMVTDFLEGMSGQVQLPLKMSASAPSWVSESNAPTSTDLQINANFMIPSTVGANIDVTRRLLAELAPGGEDWIQQDMARSIAVEIERVALNGLGNVGQPLGIFQNAAVPVVAIADDGGAPTRAKLIALEDTVGVANGDAAAGASLGWLTSPQGRAKLRSVDGSTAGSGAWLWNDYDRMLGRPAYATTNVPANITKGSGTNLTALAYGNWQDLLVNMFSAVDLMVNPYLQSVSGVTRFTALQDVAVSLRHPQSFAQIVDMITS